MESWAFDAIRHGSSHSPWPERLVDSCWISVRLWLFSTNDWCVDVPCFISDFFGAVLGLVSPTQRPTRRLGPTFAGCIDLLVASHMQGELKNGEDPKDGWIVVSARRRIMNRDVISAFGY